MNDVELKDALTQNSDFEDILFLIQNNHINLNEFEKILHKAIAKAGKFDLHPDILLHLQDVKITIEITGAL